MTYTLTKGNVKVRIRIEEETAEMTRSVGNTVDTSRSVMSPKEANAQVNSLVREGYKARKSK